MAALRSVCIPVLGVFFVFGCASHKPGAGGTSGQGGHGGDTTGTVGAPVGAAGDTGGAGTTTPDPGAAGASGGGGASATAGAAGHQVVDAGLEASLEGPPAPIGDPGTMGDGDLTISPPYTTQPDLTDKGNPKGKSFQFSMSSAQSALFKGNDPTLKVANQKPFTRRIDVYVPAQYKDGTPAPVLVIQDGPGELGLVKNALDNLTISKDPARTLPAFIAIAVANGGGDAQGSERGLEYDTMSGKYATFVDTEVLPAVVANPMVKAAFPKLSFTTNPEGRAALGCSSGGAAALAMGWFRPDLFHRIITYSGTLVAQQNSIAPEHATFPDGAWDYHSEVQLIANSPRKDLRVFLNANEMDNGASSAEAGHHNWVIANQRTSAALAAKGYHERFIFAKGVGHCDGSVRNATLADSLVWVWRGFPAP
ncbi:MAG: putative hydrolase of the alpha/beta superfamily protein [Myxococcales bacterium]|nr:putative hydrolase of the alpha/beta superfamily protein [Myxococcales bacterium]